MSHILEGSMTNKVINGVRGDFSVGSLKTDVGIFKVRNDDLLKDFDEGEYQVKVAVEHFGINVYVSKRTGIAISEILIEISAIDVIEEKKVPVEQELIEPDASIDMPVKVVEPSKTPEKKPLVKTKSKAPIVLSNKPKRKNLVKTDDRVFDLDSEADMSEVFGHLWPLTDLVKQDNTSSRTFLLVQRAYLNFKGYTLDFSTQTWAKS